MIRLPYAEGKSYGIIGLRASGRATLAALQKSGAHVELWDDREEARIALHRENTAIRMNPPDQWDWDKIEGLIMSPGVPLYFPQTHPAVSLAKHYEVPVIGDVELLYKAQPDANYLGVSGTNGKSTTTTLIAHILKENGVKMEVGGNLGPPPLALTEMGRDGSYVLEISSYQLDLIATVKFDIAVLLNLSPDHIDHHGTMQNYLAAKRRLFDRQRKKDVAIIGVDDPLCDGVAKELRAARRQCVIPISGRSKLVSGIYVKDGVLNNCFALMEYSADLRSIKTLQGEHNWQNAAAAYAACFVHGLSHDAIIRAMASYPGLAHRMQWLGEVGGVQFVNDSKATNADAAEKALRTYDNIYWIAGGVAKEGGIDSLAPYFGKIKHAYLIGEAAPAFEKTLKGKVSTVQSGTLQAAFAAAVKDAGKGSAIVLSPACASFDQYENFERRGEAFIALFEAHKKSRGGR